jgi:hypothetical protein
MKPLKWPQTLGVIVTVRERYLRRRSPDHQQAETEARKVFRIRWS